MKNIMYCIFCLLFSCKNNSSKDKTKEDNKVPQQGGEWNYLVTAPDGTKFWSKTPTSIGYQSGYPAYTGVQNTFIGNAPIK